MLRIEFHPQATQELEQGVIWYERQALGLGLEFLDEVGRAAHLIRRYPKSWPVYEYNKELRRFLLRRFPFSLVYIRRDTHIQVLACAHLRRKPGYWMNRMN